MYQKITAYFVHFMLMFSMLTLYMELTQMVQLQHRYYLTGLFALFFALYVYFTVKIYKIGENLRRLNEKVDEISDQFEV